MIGEKKRIEWMWHGETLVLLARRFLAHMVMAMPHRIRSEGSLPARAYELLVVNIAFSVQRSWYV